MLLRYRNDRLGDMLGPFHDELHRWLPRDFWGWRGGWHPRPVLPPLNVTDAGEEIVVKALVPGLDEGDVEVTVERDILRLRGKRKLADQRRYERQERFAGSFARTLELPTAVDGDKASAELRDGVLTVRLPKAREALPRKVTVKS